MANANKLQVDLSNIKKKDLKNLLSKLTKQGFKLNRELNNVSSVIYRIKHTKCKFLTYKKREWRLKEYNDKKEQTCLLGINNLLLDSNINQITPTLSKAEVLEDIVDLMENDIKTFLLTAKINEDDPRLKIVEYVEAILEEINELRNK